MQIKLLEKENKNIIYNFTQEDAPITIGRLEECKIRLKSQSISRQQWRISYINNKWILIDGDGEKPSRNGIWLYVENYHPI